MGDYTRIFRKIYPSIRQANMEVINTMTLTGELFMVPCRECEVEVFWHHASRENAPVLFEFHGGGFVLGDARKDDNLREIIKKTCDINVVGVNYRKAPEYPYPAALNDAYDVVKYFHDNSDTLRIDKDRMGVLGFSAGATLSTAIAMMAVKEKAFSLRCQILNYPYVDGVSKPGSKTQHPGDLPEEVMEAFNELYAGDHDLNEIYISPICATSNDLKGCAPAVLLMAGEDALCLEGKAYACKLLDADVPVYARVMREMHHGYMEDYYNKPCYEINPPETIAAHSVHMGERAKESMDYITKAVDYLLCD